MPQPSEFARVNPKSVLVTREQRQRSDILDTSDIEESIQRRGVLQPIIVDRNLNLIAGERRLRACLALNHSDIPVKYIEDLPFIERKIIELEENIKRKNISWRDMCLAVAEIHTVYLQENDNWSILKTARAIGIPADTVYACLRVYKHIDDHRIRDALNLNQADTILLRVKERKAAEAIGELLREMEIAIGQAEPEPNTKVYIESVLESKPIPPVQGGATWLGPDGTPLSRPVSVSENGSLVSAAGAEPGPVLCADFTSWAETYDGPKFNLVHCDFPYGERMSRAHILSEPEMYENDPEIYWKLTYALCKNLDRFVSYSANLVFWFSMNYYQETIKQLRMAGLDVLNHPLIWLHSDSKGMTPNKATQPRRVYHTALLCTRGNRELLRQIANGCTFPVVSKPVHPTQKSEPMLRHFLSALVDETTEVLDPTCGSGSALIAAEDLGARRILGLEMDPDYAKAASSHINNARILRRASRKV